MFEYIRGTLAHAIPGLAIVEAAGIGYRVQVPFSTSEVIATGSEVRLWLHHTLNAEQGEERLYGFATERERELFLALLIVQGIGPSTALQMMCAASPDKLIDAIAAGDVDTLKRLKGIGPKRAERLVIELKDKLALMAAPRRAQAGVSRQAPGALRDAVLALVALGYPSKKSEEAVNEAADKLGGGAATEALVKAALQAI